MSYKRRAEDRLKQRNLVAKHNKLRGGVHQKSHKAQRVAVRKNIRTEIEDLLEDDYDLDVIYR